MHFLCDTV